MCIRSNSTSKPLINISLIHQTLCRKDQSVDEPTKPKNRQVTTPRSNGLCTNYNGRAHPAAC